MNEDIQKHVAGAIAAAANNDDAAGMAHISALAVGALTDLRRIADAQESIAHSLADLVALKVRGGP